MESVRDQENERHTLFCEMCEGDQETIVAREEERGRGEERESGRRYLRVWLLSSLLFPPMILTKSPLGTHLVRNWPLCKERARRAQLTQSGRRRRCKLQNGNIVAAPGIECESGGCHIDDILVKMYPITLYCSFRHKNTLAVLTILEIFIFPISFLYCSFLPKTLSPSLISLSLRNYLISPALSPAPILRR